MLWTKQEEQILITKINDGIKHTEIAKELNRSLNAIRKKASRLKVKSPCNNITKTSSVYKEELPKDIVLVGNYINSYTPILHKHVCGHEWLIKPNNILNGQSCPECQKNTFKSLEPAVTYLVYFKELDLYKIGISNNMKRRLNEFGHTAEILLIHKFDFGKDAYKLEKLWLKNIEHLKINTNKLLTGNTETFNENTD